MIQLTMTLTLTSNLPRRIPTRPTAWADPDLVITPTKIIYNDNNDNTTDNNTNIN